MTEFTPSKRRSPMYGKQIPVKPLGTIRDGGLRIVIVSWARRQFANLIVVDSFDRCNWIGWDVLNQHLCRSRSLADFQRRYGPDAEAELCVYLRRNLTRAAIPAP